MKRLVVVAALALAVVLAPSPTSTLVSGVSPADAVSAATPRTAVGSAYKVFTVIGGRPVRWNPCETIPYRIRTAGAPAGGVAAVTSAVARVAQVTGTRWVLLGPSDQVPSTGALPRAMSQHVPVLIGWTDAAHSDLLRGKAKSVLGVTRTAWFGRVTATGGVAAIQGAVIALDSTDRLPATGAQSWRTVALHELGHAMGLDHAGSSAELMYPVLGRTLRDLQPGDLRGLAALGRQQGCLTF